MTNSQIKINTETKFKIQDREAGNVIEKNLTKLEAEKMLSYFIDQDIRNDSFVKDFYEIKEM